MVRKTPAFQLPPIFDQDCRQCPRLSGFLDEVKADYPHYHARPVAPFGAVRPKLLVVGLAPGMHGANATGRPFTGDHAGILLYQTLYDFGFSNRPTSESAEDGLRLKNCRITNAVKCLPPQNKPTGPEIRTCNCFLKAELEALPKGACALALGSIAHNAILRAFGLKLSEYKFAHNALHELPQGLYLLDSYHCSRYNTQTRRLTEDMFRDVFAQAQSLITR
jgi:uracil-DNA glycosylase family 4